MRAIISQRLVRTADEKGRKAAVEILINTPTIAERILNAEFQGLKEIMARSRELGMRTFDWALFELYNEGHISYEEAIANADSANELRLNIKLKSARGEPREKSGLLLAMEEDEILTPEEIERQRQREMQKQKEKRERVERERLEAEIQRNRMLLERRRQKEDEELKRLQMEKALRLEGVLAANTQTGPRQDAA
jgi:twitching motility protein PilU